MTSSLFGRTTVLARACHEGNYGLGFILSGHRAKEPAALEAKK
jgi:hypothetical protein